MTDAQARLGRARGFAVDDEGERELRSRGFTLRELAAAPPPPPTRGDCAELPRPCPALRCRYHLGAPGEAHGVSCALDQAEQGPTRLVVIAALLGLRSRQRVEQIEAGAMEKLAPKVKRLR